MVDSIKPSLEFNLGPVLWGAGTLVVLTSLSIFIIHRPGWMIPSAFVAGAVAAYKSGFYDESENNGFMAIAIGLLALIPVFLLRRYLVFSDSETTGDLVFLMVAQTAGDLVVAVMVMPVLGYIGAWSMEFIQRRTRAPIGYQ